MRAARVAAGTALAALLAGCGLPLESGVRVPGPVTGDAQEFGAVQQLPAGPQPDAGPLRIVQGFVSAQVSAEDDHAIARQFLAPEVRDSWSDDRVLIRSRELDVSVDPVDESKVITRFDVLASIAEDGSYQLESGEQRREEEYTVSVDDAGQLRLVKVPPGLRLTPEAVAGSFSPQQVFFLQDSGRPGATPHLVPDRVFLPDEDVVSALVERLLAGPSSALTDAVTTAFPPGTELRSPVSTADGVVTVDLTGPLEQLSTQQRQDLSAQLVWTLRGAGQVFTSLRLLVEGRPFRVEDAGLLQERDDWAAYDPEAGAATEALLLVNDGRIEGLTGGLPASEVTDGQLPVSAAVASPSSGDLAVLSEAPDAGDVVRIGAPQGPFTVALSQGPVGSMSWGSGDDGLWVVEDGPRPQVLLVGDPVVGGGVTPVPYVEPQRVGPLSSLRVSRDGARAAAVFGTGPSRQVYVGRVERVDGEVTRLAEFRPVARALTDVADVAWESSTSLVVLGALGTANRLPVRVAVDGSEVEPVRTLGLDGEPQTLTAAPGRPLVVGAALADRQVLFVEENGLFREPVPGSAPSYPG